MIIINEAKRISKKQDVIKKNTPPNAYIPEFNPPSPSDIQLKPLLKSTRQDMTDKVFNSLYVLNNNDRKFQPQTGIKKEN